MKAKVLPVPPIVGQLIAHLPDGSVDPADTTDCGEASLSSGVEGICGLSVSPGCIRQSLGLSPTDGRTTAANLEWFAQRIGRTAHWVTMDTAQEWASLDHLRHFGRYILLLGNWLTPNQLHWVLAYERRRSVVSVMEPWSASYASYDRAYISANSAHSQLALS